jgi:hypothetical protein
MPSNANGGPIDLDIVRLLIADSGYSQSFLTRSDRQR